MAERNEEFHSKEKVHELMAKCVTFIQRDLERFPPTEWFQIEMFYRDMGKEYFTGVMENEKGMMKVYVKDTNGDPCCPINGRLDGLFFQVNLSFWNKEIFPYSVFGPVRLKIPSKAMFDMCPNMYFADFYCYAPDKPHHVTLVMTKTDSEADKFCKEHLPQIDPQNNCFLRFTDPTTHLLRCNIWFEIFFTEDIDINKVQGAEISEVNHNIERKGPQIKNITCSHCNV